MADTRRKQLSIVAEFCLEMAVLDVLFEAKRARRCTGAAYISKDANIFRGPKPMNDAIVTGMLYKLFEQKKVQECRQVNKRGGWELTDEYFQSLNQIRWYSARMAITRYVINFLWKRF